MSDINDVIKKLDELILSLSSHGTTTRSSYRDFGLFGLNYSITLGIPDELQNTQKAKPQYYKSEDAVPLIDVIETKDEIRVIVILPNIRKDDVWADVKNSMLEVVVNKNGQVHRKEIPCDAKTEKIFIKSTNINNSVLEIVFAKG
ncbi:MAG TPA: hypothetical protein VKB83_00020 [Nitrosopumilaceae archaeon]|nr:hypothetical protein [Nitrosopumilaceae archaeon]